MTARYWDKAAEKYSRSPVSDEAAYQRKLEITRGYLRPDMELLEIGCGTGSTALVHAPRVKHILATDISANMIEIARRKAAAAGVTNVTFTHAAIEELALPDAGYDAVLALSLLHLVEDRDAVIARIARTLKPGGIFVTNTACLGDTALKWINLIAPLGQRLGLLPLVKVFGAADLTESLRRAEFTIDHTWRPGKGPVVFMVAIKAA